MNDPQGFALPQTDESPSLATGLAPTSPPATGLRLPLRPGRCDPEDLHGSMPSSSAGGERAQGTTNPGRLARARARQRNRDAVEASLTAIEREVASRVRERRASA